ncbi:MAG: hypothetical protein LC785_08440 [Acidobacteria bacterium]|nr:hypothetical protein [Acidobacteriota bacterium]MCA1641962.1 hypothetical protein [Acidobacteriota bacterium]
MRRRIVSLSLTSILLSSHVFALPPSRTAHASNGRTPPSASSSAPPDLKQIGWLDVRVSPLFDLYYLARRHATSDAQKIVGYEWLQEVVDAVRQLERDFGGRFTPLWSILDANLMDCRDAADAVRLFAQLSETREFRGKQFPLRAGALRLANALSVAEPQFRKLVWSKHKKIVDGAARMIRKEFKPKEQDCLAYISKSLRLGAPQKQLPLYLVAEAQYPGGFTYLLREGGRMSVVAVALNEGTLMLETVLHEAIHSLDGVGSTGAQEGADAGSVLMELRERLRKAGVAERDVGDAAHLLIFIQAAETVRHVIDAKHKPYGEVAGVYEKLPRVNALVPVWVAHLDGKLTREDALTQAVEKIAAATKAASSEKSNAPKQP